MESFIHNLHQLGLDATFFYQFFIVLIFLPICVMLLAKPLFQAYLKRELLTSGYKEKAEALVHTRNELEKNYETQMIEAQKKAQKAFEEAASKGQEEIRGLLVRGRTESSRQIETLRGQTENTIKQLKSQLALEVKVISKEIVGRLIQ